MGPPRVVASTSTEAQSGKVFTAGIARDFFRVCIHLPRAITASESRRRAAARSANLYPLVMIYVCLAGMSICNTPTNGYSRNSSSERTNIQSPPRVSRPKLLWLTERRRHVDTFESLLRRRPLMGARTGIANSEFALKRAL
ncbi:hypothetical protein PAXRUDRAFT_214398 [Paxillus rubicundulus Ve08.2h10]|uniref:Uncharacterized protein n=1 Tax=Paxillus rubicundulus Ve08.2h10 TaxID=930991 RepID=A0A0D0DH99_9AGAM|nr:hypothetical protein PAXRUDRAFT_214398 [Paxillus rubicundulus Ve08.2h10]